MVNKDVFYIGSPPRALYRHIKTRGILVNAVGLYKPV